MCTVIPIMNIFNVFSIAIFCVWCNHVIIMSLEWHCLYKMNGYSHGRSMPGMCSMDTSSSI